MGPGLTGVSEGFHRGARETAGQQKGGPAEGLESQGSRVPAESVSRFRWFELGVGAGQAGKIGRMEHGGPWVLGLCTGWST